MAKRLLCRATLCSNTISIKSDLCYLGNVQCNKIHTNEVPVKEIQIPVKWGHLAGKLWGSGNSRPILALHGWQDNAGTWDPIAPMLVKDRPILAIDFPGHGLSSWIPPGMQYYSWELPRLILYIKKYFKWDKVSLLSHSLGSIAAVRFASLFSNDVDFYIGIDSLIYDDHDLEQVLEKFPMLLEKIMVAQTRLDEEPPIYTLDEMKEIWYKGTRKSVELENTIHLLKRGSKPSKRDPSKYYFSRDSRLKYSLFNPEDKKFVESLIRRFKCPALYFKAIDSPYASDEYSVEMREVIARNNEKFECHFVPGTHHVHINNPQLLAPIILRFLKKYTNNV